MKILLANPSFRLSISTTKEKYLIRAGSRWPFFLIKHPQQPSPYLPFPFFLSYTASLLEKLPWVDLDVLDSIALNQSETDFLVHLASTKPDVILFEATTASFIYDITLAKKIKKLLPKVIICLAGFHVTSLPQKTLVLSKGNIDYLFLHEYELIFLRFIKTLHRRQSVASIPSLAYIDRGRIRVNRAYHPSRLACLPFPARHLFPTPSHSDPTLYWDGFCQLKPAIQMLASRGCPFHCNFCAWNQIMYQNQPYRPRDPEDICQEISQLIDSYHPQEIYFDDDTFTGNPAFVKKLCRLFIKHKFPSKLKWSAMTDFILTDKRLIRLMEKSGCIGLKFGVESGNPGVLQNIPKPIHFSRLKNNLRVCRQLHIKTHATYTFGLLGETKKSLDDTLQLACSLDTDSAQFSITTPFPGTKYYQQLKKYHRLLSTNWQNFDGNNTSVVNFDDFDNHYLAKFFNQSTSIWLKTKLKNPNWIAHQLFFFFRSFYYQGFPFLISKIYRLVELLFPRNL